MDRSCGKLRTKFEGPENRAPFLSVELGVQAGFGRFVRPSRILAAILPDSA